MSFGEVFLRLGCSLVAWMVVYTHCIWTAMLRVTGCVADGDELWRLLLGLAPLTLGFCLLLNVSHKLTEVHRIVAWLAVPLLVLIPLALVAVWPWLDASTLGRSAICADGEASTWQVWWAPVQLVTLAAIALAVTRVWRGRVVVPSKH